MNIEHYPQLIKEHIYDNQKYDLLYMGFDYGYRDCVLQKFEIVSVETLVPIFYSSISKRLDTFSFGYKNWIFVPEVLNYYLFNLEDNTVYNQTVWFRKNNHNFKNSNIGNFFDSQFHYTVNTKSFVIFELDTLNRQIIKPKEPVSDFGWVYRIDNDTLRIFFNSINQTALYNMKEAQFYDFTPIIIADQKFKLINTKRFELVDGKHITYFKSIDVNNKKSEFEYIEEVIT